MFLLLTVKLAYRGVCEPPQGFCPSARNSLIIIIIFYFHNLLHNESMNCINTNRCTGIVSVRVVGLHNFLGLDLVFSYCFTQHNLTISTLAKCCSGFIKLKKKRLLCIYNFSYECKKNLNLYNIIFF